MFGGFIIFLSQSNPLNYIVCQPMYVGKSDLTRSCGGKLQVVTEMLDFQSEKHGKCCLQSHYGSTVIFLKSF